MKDRAFSHVHSSWEPVFQPIYSEVQSVLSQIDPKSVVPNYENIFRAFSYPLEDIRCVIFGQDPYPTPGHATGLAFSVPSGTAPLPPTLRNILREFSDDLGIDIPSSGALDSWSRSGVLLLNRVLTAIPGESNSHLKLGWQRVTSHIAAELGKRGVIAILWGNQAQELSSFFEDRVESVHPSPLSAYRGFFGSKPFSKVNQILLEEGREPINWTL
jgi:uracil-DNA glycosylase